MYNRMLFKCYNLIILKHIFFLSFCARLGDSYRVCVADFGLSKQIDSNYYRQKTNIRVPFRWMSPESLSESVYTTKSDVVSPVLSSKSKLKVRFIINSKK